MSSLKEQRERLLQAKMREMANIGVTKRTADNIPDFDEPIDLDDEPTLEENPTLEEECNAVSETEETTSSTPTPLLKHLSVTALKESFRTRGRRSLILGVAHRH